MTKRLRVRIPAGVAGDFSPPELTLCADFYSVSIPTPLLPQRHIGDPGHSAKSANKQHKIPHLSLVFEVQERFTPLHKHSALSPVRAEGSNVLSQGIPCHALYVALVLVEKCQLDICRQTRVQSSPFLSHGTAALCSQTHLKNCGQLRQICFLFSFSGQSVSLIWYCKTGNSSPSAC